jgi:endonuclease/exonuclease/phosphatase family metal-dependent hydrolase
MHSIDHAPTRIASLNFLHEARSFSRRLPQMKSELARLNLDILIGQEVRIDLEHPGRLFPELEQTTVAAGFELATSGRNRRGGSGNAIFYRPARFSVLETGFLAHHDSEELKWLTPDTVFAVLSRVGGGTPPVVVFSMHAAWGAQNGGHRFADVQQIEAQAKILETAYPGALVILGGDMNEFPCGASIHYLTGKTAALPGAYWVDMWEWLRPGEIGATQLTQSEHGLATSRGVGYDPVGPQPDRRIDFLLARGWVYHLLGANPTVELWGQPDGGDVSDHLGLVLTF